MSGRGSGNGRPYRPGRPYRTNRYGKAPAEAPPAAQPPEPEAPPSPVPESAYPPAPQGRTGRKKGPTSVHEALQQYLKRSGLEERIDEASAVPEWAERVGPGIAAVTTPLRASGGTLVVAVRSSAWLMELQLMESTILRQVNAGRKHGKFTRIRFVMAEAT